MSYHSLKRALAACLVPALVLAAAACESTDGAVSDFHVDTLDAAPDTADDTIADLMPDMPVDTPVDAAPDPVPDAPPDRVEEDTGADTTADPVDDDGSGAVCYTEPVYPDADLSDLEAWYSGSNYLETEFEALSRRWPAGYDLLDAMRGDPYLGTFTDTTSFATVMESLMTEVHEETHGWDYEHASWGSTFAYYVRADLTYTTTWVDGFPRSEIRAMLADDSTDLYEFYLQGEQGTYGFVELLDEMNCYINGMAGIAYVGDTIEGWGISGIDGAVAFMYYLELYLKRARTMYADLYISIKGEAAFVDMIRTQWLRLHFFLQQADRFPLLGIHDDAIRVHMYNTDNQSEIEMLIDHPVAASNCLP
ncbi:MAG: hypothetical protein ABIJ56_15905 [Pseudomonadota bacterium]